MPVRRVPLTLAQILTWADAYHERSGIWPRSGDREVLGAPGETWHGLDMALRKGFRGLPRGWSLARLLAQERGVRNHQDLPPLTEEQILAWAEAHHHHTGSWPGPDAGPVAAAPGETWRGLNEALRDGRRGLPGGTTLRQLLAGAACAAGAGQRSA